MPVSAVYGFLFLVLAKDGVDSIRMWILVITLVATALLWSLCVGNAYFATFVRRRGFTGRTECTLLGTVIAVTTLVIFWFVFDLGLIHLQLFLDLFPKSPRDPALGPISFWEVSWKSLLSGICLSPLGLFGGWLFWRIGVRSAKTLTGDLAPVFD
jgi:hypothetical protein